MKTVISFIQEDYFSYVGTNPLKSELQRAQSSIPYEFSKYSSFKYKRVNDGWNRLYFIILVVDIDKERLDKVIRQASENMIICRDFKYRTINTCIAQ